MADEHKQNKELSRRELFQLRARSRGHELLGTKDKPAMQPVAEPPNHDGLDMSQLPRVHEANLSADQVSALFADIEHCATDIQFVASSTTNAKVDSANYLRSVCEKLLNGEIAKVQIRYHWQDARWIDTLERQSTGTRLVRIAHS